MTKLIETNASPLAAPLAPVLALTAAQTLASFGNSLAAVAIPWFVLQTTGSSTRTGLTAAVAGVAAFLSMAFGSAAVDRFGYRRMSVISDALSLISVAAIPLVYHLWGLSFASLVALIFVGGLLDSPGSTARSTMLPELAGRAGLTLERANSLIQGSGSVAVLAGPIVGGFLVAWVGASNVLWFNAATFALSIVIILTLVPAVARHGAVTDAKRSSYLEDVRAGWVFLWRQPLIRALSIAATVINFVTNPMVAVLLPVLVYERLGNPHILGWMLGAFGAGDLVGVVLYGWRGHRLPRRPALAIGISAYAVSALLAGFGAPWPVLIVVFFLNALVGGPINPSLMTVVQERVEPALLGRVMGAVIATALVAAPLGLAAGGFLVGLVGLTPVFVIVAVVLLIMGLWLAWTPALATIDGRTVTDS